MIDLTRGLIPRPNHGTGRRTVTFAGAMVLAMVMVHWGWKKVGVPLFDLPEARFSQAMIAVLVFVALLALIRVVFGPTRSGTPS